MSTPSLLNIPYLYKAGTLYSQIPESGAGDFTVSRTTTVANRSTRINKDGLIELVADNVPRLDYPLGGAVNGCPALLVEPSAQNLLPRSQEFDNASWFKDRLNTTGTPPWVNVEVAPDGTTTAEKFIQASGEMLRGTVQQSLTVTSGVTYTISVFAKQGSRHIPAINQNIDGTNKFVWFNTSNGTVGTVAAGLSASIENYGNGWYRCSVRVTASTTASRFVIFNNTETDGTTIVSDDGGFQFFWGAQVETGSVPTSYIPTTTAAVTRSADVISDTTATALIGQSEGTIYMELVASNFGAEKMLFQIDNGTATQRVAAFYNTTGGITFATANSSQYLLSTGVNLSLGVHKVALSYSNNNLTAYVNGSLYASGTPTHFPIAALNQITLGSRINAGVYGIFLNDRIRATELHPNRLTNAQLATLTAL